jgi:hypothetical protein
MGQRVYRYSEDEGQTWRKLAALRGSTAPG